MRLHDQAGRLVERRRRADVDAVAEIAHHAHVAAPLGREHAERACAWLARAADVAVSRTRPPRGPRPVAAASLSDAAPGSLTAARRHRGDRGGTDPARPDGRGARRPRHRRRRSRSEHGDWSLVAEAAAVLIGAGRLVVARARCGAPAARRGADRGRCRTSTPRSQARLLAILQMEHFYAWRSDIVEEYGRRSVELARGVGDVALLREVLMLRLVALDRQLGRRWAPARSARSCSRSGPTGELAVTALFHLGSAPGGTAATRPVPTRPMRRCAEAAAASCGTPASTSRSAGGGPPGHATSTTRRTTGLIDEALATHRRAGYIASRELECLHAIRRGPVGSPVDGGDRRAGRGGRDAGPRALVAHALLEAGQPERAHALLGERVPDDSRRLLLHGRSVPAAAGPRRDGHTGADPGRRSLRSRSHLGAPVSYGTIDHLGVVDHFVAAAYAALGDDRAVAVARSAVEHNRRLGVAPVVASVRGAARRGSRERVRRLKGRRKARASPLRRTSLPPAGHRRHEREEPSDDHHEGPRRRTAGQPLPRPRRPAPARHRTADHPGRRGLGAGQACPGSSTSRSTRWPSSRSTTSTT